MSLERTRELRDAFAEGSGFAAGCPAADLLWSSARSELTGEANEAVILHLAECGACATSWRLARALDPATAAGRSPAKVAGRRPAGWRAVVLALAASVMLIAGALALRMVPEVAPPAMRAPRVDWLRPSAGMERLDRAAPVLRWTAGPEGTFYDVRVTTADLDILANGWRLTEPELRLDPAALAALPTGAVIYWQVTARLPDGHGVDSPTFTTRVER